MTEDMYSKENIIVVVPASTRLPPRERTDFV